MEGVENISVWEHIILPYRTMTNTSKTNVYSKKLKHVKIHLTRFFKIVIKRQQYSLQQQVRALFLHSHLKHAQKLTQLQAELTREQLSHPPHGADEDRRSVQQPALEQPAPVFLDPLPAEGDRVPVKLQRLVPQHGHTCISW